MLRLVGGSVPSWAYERFGSTYASARPAVRASGEAQDGEAGGLRGAGVTTSTSQVFGEARAHTARAGRSLRPRRDFIEKRYVELKKANPDLPILIRECSDVQPKLWARYGECGTLGIWDPRGETRIWEEKGPLKVKQKLVETGTHTSALLLTLLTIRKFTFVGLYRMPCVLV